MSKIKKIFSSKTSFILNLLSVFLLNSGAALGQTVDDIVPPGLPLPGPQGGVVQILANLVIWFMTIFGIIAMVGFIISGIQYISSSGNEAVAENAKRNLKYSLIGVIVGLSGYIIIKAVYAALTADTFFF